MVVRLGTRGIEGDRPADERQRLVGMALLDAGDPEVMQCAGVLGRAPQDRPIRPLGLCQPAVAVQGERGLVGGGRFGDHAGDSIIRILLRHCPRKRTIR